MKRLTAICLSLACLFAGNAAAESAPKKNHSAKYARIYNKALSGQDKKDIHFIIKTLGLGSMAKIISNKSSLKKAGDRIRPIHPLKFLGFIFSNEELKACVHNIRHSYIPFVWSEFWGGLRDSLTDEAKAGNLTAAQIADFCKAVGINQAIVAPSLEAGKWQEFFDLLLKHIPRSENADRYNI